MTSPLSKEITRDSKSVPAGTTKATAPFFTGSVSSTCTCALEGYSTISIAGAAAATPDRHHIKAANNTRRFRITTSLCSSNKKRGPFSHLPKHLSIFISQRGGDSVSPNSLEKAMTISRVSDPSSSSHKKRLPRPAQEAFACNFFCVRVNPHTGIPYKSLEAGGLCPRWQS